MIGGSLKHSHGPWALRGYDVVDSNGVPVVGLRANGCPMRDAANAAAVAEAPALIRDLCALVDESTDAIERLPDDENTQRFRIKVGEALDTLERVLGVEVENQNADDTRGNK